MFTGSEEILLLTLVGFALLVDQPCCPPGVLAAATGLAVITAGTKIATGLWSARQAGIGRPGRLGAGTVLTGRGEFSIVIAGIAVAEGVDAGLGPFAAAFALQLTLGGPLTARGADPVAAPSEPRLSAGAGQRRSGSDARAATVVPSLGSLR